MGVPDPLIMATCEHFFPEHEFEFDDNPIRCAETGPRVDQVLPLLVNRPLAAGRLFSKFLSQGQ